MTVMTTHGTPLHDEACTAFLYHAGLWLCEGGCIEILTQTTDAEAWHTYWTVREAPYAGEA